MRPASFASSTSPHSRHVAPRLVFASEPSFMSPCPRRTSELEFADQSLSPRVEQRRSAPVEPERVRDSVPKPRSRRCFVCGTTGRHPLDFRVCPRTTVLLRRSLAKINDDGRLVSIDDSPLPMTRHPGGVAAHMISRFNNPLRIVREPPRSTPVPCAAYVPPLPVSSELHDRVPRPSCEPNLRDPARIVPPSPESVPVPRVAHIPPPPCKFNPSSLHAIPPVDRAVLEPEHIPLRRFTSPFDCAHHDPSEALSRARALWIGVLLDSLLNSVFRSQLRAIVSLVDGLGVQDPSTLRERLQPVFTRISHLIPAT
ncbi:hypothetical protein MVEN_01831700 [Mycena venus]|uniref:Uncharacterized protein n=1 Tax=Mycena venus TaxID=2733690 RepID=A0A8H6XL43_9AGAR|nr:hypothetical protein MVEN_01831700 [Mycena venus]